MKTGDWTWIEVAKLIATLFTPITIAIFSIVIHRITKRFEHSQWRSQKLIEKRLNIYDDLSPHFNDLLCYFTYVGTWKEMAPSSIVSLKRTMDKKIHLATPLFSRSFYDACSKFQVLCFEMHGSWKDSPLLRTHMERRKEAYPKEWQEDWNICFGSSPTPLTDIKNAYVKVMESFAREIGVHDSYFIPVLKTNPINVR